jgi:hypothetical protein
LFDISNTYWALDALAAASRRGLRIPPAVWDGGVRALTSWGTYFRNVHCPRYRFIWNRALFSKEVREFFRERDRRDTVLRISRRLRVDGHEGDPPGPQEQVVDLDEASFWPYTNYCMRQGPPPRWRENLGDLFLHTNGYAAQVSGVGALVLSLEGLGQKALRSRVVEQGLLYTRVHFRHVLATMDVRPCSDEHGEPELQYWLPPRDLGYSFLLLERVLDGLGIERLGSHEWFPLLALHSLDLQREDGGWYPWRGDRLVPTALHVLALSRSRKPDFAEDLPVYRRGPIITGTGHAAAIGSALVESREGKLHRVVEVLASLEHVGREERIELARKAIQSLTPGQRAELLPLLRRAAEDGPTPSKTFARKAIAEIEAKGANENRE